MQQAEIEREKQERIEKERIEKELQKFEYEISILSTFTKYEWKYIFKLAEIEMPVEMLPFGFLFGIKNRLFEFDHENVYLTFREIDKLSRLFEFSKNMLFFDKCSNMCEAINNEFKRISDANK